MLYEREADVYQFDCVRKSPCIRAMYETVENGTDKCMVFEWMDRDLWSLRHQKRSCAPVFLKTVAKSVLTALTPFSDMDGQGEGVHTGTASSVELVAA